MTDPSPDIVVAGLICLDIILPFDGYKGDLSQLVRPGKAVNVGAAIISTGGAVANTGLALHQLGISTRLIGKIGQDHFGETILDILQKHGSDLTEKMIVSKEDSTSYSIVISPPGMDRSFLYNPGANDTFRATDISPETLEGARYFHFGYPSEMQMIYADGGEGLAQLLSEIKQVGLTTSLDMSYPDVSSEAGMTDWRAWMKTVLPHVDIFLPSYDEILLMMDRPLFEQMDKQGTVIISKELLLSLSQELLEMGAGIVVLKLGDQGLFMQTTDDPERLSQMGKGRPAHIDRWTNQRLMSPCFQANVAGTTGAGDCTIAGFLAAMNKGMSPEEVMIMATAVGGFSVEQADASSGVPQWEVVCQRIEDGWPRMSSYLSLD
ncbi:MAG: carbohydrate kinase family protein [Bacteroidota bacterium]